MTDDMRFIPASIRVKRGDKTPSARYEPNELQLAPGRTAELDRQFTDIGEFYYGSPASGDQAGTIATVLVY